MFLDLAGTPELDAVTVVIRVLPKRMTDYIDDKRIFGGLAKRAGVEGVNSAVPRTFESVADAVKVLGADPAASKHIFIKYTYGSGGAGAHVELTENLKNKDFKLGEHQIIKVLLYYLLSSLSTLNNPLRLDWATPKRNYQ